MAMPFRSRPRYGVGEATVLDAFGDLGQLLALTRLPPRPYHPNKDAAAQDAFKKTSRIA